MDFRRLLKASSPLASTRRLPDAIWQLSSTMPASGTHASTLSNFTKGKHSRWSSELRAVERGSRRSPTQGASRRCHRNAGQCHWYYSECRTGTSRLKSEASNTRSASHHHAGRVPSLSLSLLGPTSSARIRTARSSIPTLAGAPLTSSTFAKGRTHWTAASMVSVLSPPLIRPLRPTTHSGIKCSVRSSSVSASVLSVLSSANPQPTSVASSTAAAVANIKSDLLALSTPKGLGRRRRHLLAMHRAKLKRQLLDLQLAVPKHSSQLSGYNGDALGLMRSSGGSIKKGRLRRWQRNNRQESSLQDGVSKPAVAQPQYHHIHYYYSKGQSPRLRFLGFRHFLGYSRSQSQRGQHEYLNDTNRKAQWLAMKHDRIRFSSKRRFVRVYQRVVANLDRSLARDQQHQSIRSTKILLRQKQAGAPQPDGRQLAQVVAIDAANYKRAQRTWLTKLQRQAVRQQKFAAKFLDQALLALERHHFTTLEYNLILERCLDLKDWGHGAKIAQMLLVRYQSPGFMFQGPVTVASPNARTVHLLLSLFVESGHYGRAVQVLSCVHRRNPAAAPLQVYGSFLNKLAVQPGQVPRIERILRHMEAKGPAPSVSIYNALVKAIGRKEGYETAGGVLHRMASAGYQCDQQTFSTLVDQSLYELDMEGAQFWLAESERQGYEIKARMLQPFMRTCVQQAILMMPRSKSPSSSSILDHAGLYIPTKSREWMYKALQVMQFLTMKKLAPTAQTYDHLIEGFLAHAKIKEAKQALKIMTTTYLYTPTSRTWTLFFDFYLRIGDDGAAMRVLNEMRRPLQQMTPPISMTKSSEMGRPGQLLTTPQPVPTKMYHALFRHLLDHNKVTAAERSLYEMLIRQRRARPTEKEVVDLIWRLERRPEAAERVYELLYSQTEPSSKDMSSSYLGHQNRILVEGPIQWANVGVMRAKAMSKSRVQQDQALMSWAQMTQFFEEGARVGSDPQQGNVGHGGHGLSSIETERMKVLGVAFEQVSRASRKPTLATEQKEMARRAEAEREAHERALEADRWDFDPRGPAARRGRGGMGAGTGGLGLRLGGADVRDGTLQPFPSGFSAGPTTAQGVAGGNRTLGWMGAHHLEFRGKHRQLIQQLLSRHGYLQPLLDRRAAAAASTVATVSGPSSSFGFNSRLAAFYSGASHRIVTDEDRLESLKKGFQWVVEKEVPIGIQGLNAYMESLVSYEDYGTLKEVVHQWLIPQTTTANTTTTMMTTKARGSVAQGYVKEDLAGCFKPDLKTLLILEQSAMGGGGGGRGGSGSEDDLVGRVLHLGRGGRELVDAWRRFKRG